MSINLNDNTYIKAGKPSEAKYLNGTVDYISTSEVETLIPISERYLGLTVRVNGQEYWFETSIANGNLVNKIVSVGATNGLTANGGEVGLGSPLVKDTTIDGTFALNLGSTAAPLKELNQVTKSYKTLVNFIEDFDIGTGTDDDVNEILEQTDGKILIGGEFSTLNGVSLPNNIARLNTDGSVDTTFNVGGTGLNSSCSHLEIQPDGKILVGHYASEYNGVSIPNGLIRLNADGSLDTTFNTNLGTGPDYDIYTTEVQPDNKILIGGYFESFNGATNISQSLLRLNADGTVDNTWNVGGIGYQYWGVEAIELQSDNKIIVAGWIDEYNGATAGTYGISRINTDGTQDFTFNIGTAFDNDAYSLIVLPDDSIYVAGAFSEYNSLPVSIAIIKLNSDGTIDNTFNSGGSGFDNDVYEIRLTNDNKIMATGNFSSYNGVSVGNICIINTDGSLDTTFNDGGIGFNDRTYMSLSVSDGSYLVGGRFTEYNGNPSSPQNFIKLYSDGIYARSAEVSVEMDGIGALKYPTDLSSLFQKHSLIDKNYVDEYARNNKVFRTLYVSANYGNDLTGEPYNINKPYKTITAAKNASIFGDRIHVDTGNYEENSLTKNGIEYYFNFGAVVTSTSATIWHGQTGRCFVTGYGQFVSTNTATAPTVFPNSTGQELYIKCLFITNFAADNRAVDSTLGLQRIEIDCNKITSYSKGAVRFQGGANPNNTRCVLRNAIVEIPSSIDDSVREFDVVDVTRAESVLLDNVKIINHNNNYGCMSLGTTTTVVGAHEFRNCLFQDRSTTGIYMVRSWDLQERTTVHTFENCKFVAIAANTTITTFVWYTATNRDSKFYFVGTNLSNRPLGDPYNGGASLRARLVNENNGFIEDADFFVNWPISDT